MSYLSILVAKTFENILATLRIIVLSNHRKLLGAVLNLFISIIWIFSTIFVLNNFDKHPLSIIVYVCGCFIGSYLGASIEEKLAIGTNMLTCITDKNNIIEYKLKQLGYTVISIYDYNNDNKILLIMIPRKKKYIIYKIIKRIDKNATIISENATYYEKK